MLFWLCIKLLLIGYSNVLFFKVTFYCKVLLLLFEFISTFSIYEFHRKESFSKAFWTAFKPTFCMLGVYSLAWKPFILMCWAKISKKKSHGFLTKTQNPRNSKYCQTKLLQKRVIITLIKILLPDHHDIKPCVWPFLNKFLLFISIKLTCWKTWHPKYHIAMLMFIFVAPCRLPF